MAVKRLPANPEVLRWARIQQGFELHEAAALLSVEIEELSAIEDGRELVPARLLDRMIQVYEASESILLLPKPPPIRPLPEDYRTPFGLAPRLLPPTRVAIREAWEFVEDATALVFADDAPGEVLARLPVVTVGDDPSAVANLERARLGVTYEQQIGWRDRQAFEGWRAALDRVGVLVLLKSMPWDDCRGFLLWDADLLPAAVVNSVDSDNARTFTLFHEYGHLLLREPSACVQTEHDMSRKPSEDWCNAFAASLLVPKDILDLLVAGKVPRKPMGDWSLGDYRFLSGKFRVSTMAIARRMKELYGDTFYDTHFLELRGYDRQKLSSTHKGGPLPSVVRLSEVGQPMAQRIFAALQANHVSARDAADLLRLSAGQMSALAKLAI